MPRTVLTAALSGCLACSVLALSEDSPFPEAPRDIATVAHSSPALSRGTSRDAGGARFVVGTRATYFTLLETDSDGFLGSINHLDAQQDLIPYKVFADWLITPDWGLELTWDRIRAETRTAAADAHSDGIFGLAGPILTAFYRHRNSSAFTPYLGAGLVYLLGSFDAESWWALGYAHEEDWIALGSSNEIRKRMTRSIEVDNTLGLVADAGLAVAIARGWSADAYVRYLKADATATFTEKQAGRTIRDKSNDIPFSNVAFGLGVRCGF